MLLTRLAPVVLSGLRACLRALPLATCACLPLPPRPAPGPAPALPQDSDEPDSVPLAEGFPLVWNPGQVLLQGYLGASYLSDFQVSPSGAPPIELDDDEYEVLPVIGGGAQMKLAGNALDFGVEGFVAFSGRTDLEAFASSGGSAVAVFDVSLLVFEAYGGPFVSRFVGDRMRVYAGTGPLLQWVGYDQDDQSSAVENEDAEGFGGGYYVRGGLEFLLPSRKLVGFGARWSDSSIDLGQDFGDLDLSGLELFFTYSYGLQPRSRYTWD